MKNASPGWQTEKRQDAMERSIQMNFSMKQDAKYRLRRGIATVILGISAELIGLKVLTFIITFAHLCGIY